MSSRLIAVINKTTTTFVGDEGHAKLDLLARFCALQLDRDVTPLWGLDPWDCQYFENENDPHIPGDAIRHCLFEQSDQAGAAGYHTEDPQGNPIVKSFTSSILGAGGTIFGTGSDLSLLAVMNHENAETVNDEDAESYTLLPDGLVFPMQDGSMLTTKGHLAALEVGDPVQNDSYKAVLSSGEVGYLSNFVLPDWFSWGRKGQVGFRGDFMGKTTSPFEVRDGYIILFHSTNGVTPSFSATMPKWQIEQKLRNDASRLLKRIRSVFHV